MNEPFVTFDTLTVGDDLDAPQPAAQQPAAKLPPILARLPKLDTAPPRPATRNRFDEAEATIPYGHIADASPYATPPTGAAPQAGPTVTLGDPTATIRIDTVTPLAPERSNERPKPQPYRDPRPAEPASVPFRPAPPVEESLDDPWSAWLLNLEATIQPYSRWIALAAVIAALGLTIVLLRGGGVIVEAPETSPQVSGESGSTTLATSTESTEAPSWPTPIEPTGPVITSVDTPAFVDATPVASGPASAPRRSGHAKLTGEVLAPPSGRVDIAEAPTAGPFPRTTR